MNTPTTAQTPDTSVPMDIDQNKHRSETQLTESTELNLKSLVAEAVAAVMDAREIGKMKNPRRVFRQVNRETHALSDQQVLGLRNKYSRVYQRYVDLNHHLLSWS